MVREVAASLPESRRRILALWGAGLKRPEIAARLGLSERAVKRAIEEIMQETRIALARQAGGGCEQGEPLVLRMVCGLAAATEAEQARAHLAHCGRCAGFAGRLEAWREKAGALLPVPVAEASSPGLLGRLADRGSHALASVKQQVLGGGAQVKQQVAAGYSRAVDPTPLAAVRPGAVAAVVAGCIAVGSGRHLLCPAGNRSAGTCEGSDRRDSGTPGTTNATGLDHGRSPCGAAGQNAGERSAEL